MTTLAYTEQLTVVTCYSCSMPYAIPDNLHYRALREEPGKLSIYCPMGHQWHYLGESHEAKIARLERRNANLNEELRIKEAGRKREVTKRRNVEKRIAAGVCPHCHRTFKQVRAHMKSQHPDKVTA